MSTVSISASTSQSMSAPAPVANKDPLAGMTLLTADGQQPPRRAAIEDHQKRSQAHPRRHGREGISPDAGGLRVGIQGGGCSGLSCNIRFDTQPRERDRTFVFGEGVETPTNDPSGGESHPPLRRPQELHLPRRSGPRLRRDPHAPGLQLHQPQLHQKLRLRVELFGVDLRFKYCEIAFICSALELPRPGTLHSITNPDRHVLLISPSASSLYRTRPAAAIVPPRPHVQASPPAASPGARTATLTPTPPMPRPPSAAC